LAHPEGALFELGDALLCAQTRPSLPHMSLEPVCRRGGAASTTRWLVVASRLSDCDLLIDLIDYRDCWTAPVDAQRLHPLTTPTAPPPRRSARCWHGCPMAPTGRVTLERALLA
jgi:hypothetical protein